MRKIIVLVIGLVVIGCKSKQVANQINHESEINLVVDNWHQAAAEAKAAADAKGSSQSGH